MESLSKLLLECSVPRIVLFVKCLVVCVILINEVFILLVQTVKLLIVALYSLNHLINLIFKAHCFIMVDLLGLLLFLLLWSLLSFTCGWPLAYTSVIVMRMLFLLIVLALSAHAKINYLNCLIIDKDVGVDD